MVGRVSVGCERYLKFWATVGNDIKWFSVLILLSVLLSSVFLTSIKWLLSRWSKINVLCCRKVTDQFSHKQKPAGVVLTLLLCQLAYRGFSGVSCVWYRWIMFVLGTDTLPWLGCSFQSSLALINGRFWHVPARLVVESKCIIHYVQ